LIASFAGFPYSPEQEELAAKVQIGGSILAVIAGALATHAALALGVSIALVG
jgi:hypothetical protein